MKNPPLKAVRGQGGSVARLVCLVVTISAVASCEGSHETSAPAAPNAPAGANANPQPLSADVETRRTLGETTLTMRKTVTRGKDRVHVLMHPMEAEAPGQEWLYVRDSSDGARVTPTYVEHVLRAIVTYRENERASAGADKSWAELASLGVKPEVLQNLRAGTKKERAFGFEFTEYLLPEGVAGSVRQLWWSDQAAAPLRWMAEDERGRTTVSVVIRSQVDTSLLRDPRERFPTYEVMDLPTLRARGGK